MTDPMDTSPMIIQGPDLPNILAGHCVVNSDDVMKALITGGVDSVDSTLNAANIFSFEDETWQQGLPFTEGRAYHACGVLNDGNNHIIIIAGGVGQTNNLLSSVELYNLGSGVSWYAGPEFANAR